MTPTTKRERFLIWLGVVPITLLDRINAERIKEIEHQHQRIGKLWFALAEITPELTQNTRDRLNSRLLNQELFEEEMDSRPVFPYGNDSRSPR